MIEVVEIVLICIALFYIFRNKVEIPLLIMQVFIEFPSMTRQGVSHLFFEHNFADVSIILFLVLAFRLYFRKPRPLGEVNALIKPVKNGILVFAVFLVIAAVVDLFANNVSPVSIIKVWRGWAFFFLLWLLNRITRREVLKFLKYLMYFCMGYSVFAIGQFMLYAMGTTDSRAGMVLSSSFLVFLLMLHDFYCMKSWQRWVCIGIFVVHMIVFGSRSLFGVTLMAVFYYLFIENRGISLSKVGLIGAAMVVLVVILGTNNVLNNRLRNTSGDIQASVSNKNITSNFTFRIYMTIERAQYISENPQYAIFGLGNVQEKDFHKHIFTVGLSGWSYDYNGNYIANTVQLDTADTAWPLLLVRYGFVGSAIYVIFVFIPSIRAFYRGRKKSKMCASMWVFLILNLCVMSVAGSSTIAFSYFWLIPIASMLLLEAPDQKLKRRKRAVRKRRAVNVTHLVQFDYDS